MYTLMQFVLLSTLLASAIAFPQKPENSSISENQFTTSQKLLSENWVENPVLIGRLLPLLSKVTNPLAQMNMVE